MTITSLDLAFVEQAAKLLEHSSFLMRVSTFLGRPIEAATERLPDKARSLITQSVDKALKGSLRMAVSTLEGGNQESTARSSQRTPTTKKWVHTAAAMGLGAVSGAAGGWSLVLELPVTTTVMMRSMAAMAQAANFNPRDPEIALEILSVFAYGSPMVKRGINSPAESTFFADRAALKMLIKESASYVAGKSVRQVLTSLDVGGAPRLLEFMSILSRRMNFVVSEKFLAQGLPIIGAAGGAMLNGLFNDYYSNVAYYVFGLRRLELLYGPEAIRQAYEDAAARLKIDTNPIT
ncbi:MAG: EcsC family protein [Proteobacteria bacterium]|nr:EcsC family protein [Pseudomonadota bacterium]